MALPSICKENLIRLPALVKMGQIVLLLITIGIAQIGDTYPGFGGAVSSSVESTTSNSTEPVHYVENKHLYFFGAGICTCYLINCCVLVLCYFLSDTSTQTSKYELVMSVLGSILFLSMAMKIFVGSSGSDDVPKLITEGCCCLGVAILQIFDAIFIHLRIKKGDGSW